MQNCLLRINLNTEIEIENRVFNSGENLDMLPRQLQHLKGKKPDAAKRGEGGLNQLVCLGKTLL